MTNTFLTLQKRRPLKIGVPIELHTKSVYTQAMYNKFEEQLFKAGSFAVVVSSEHNKFIVCHAIKCGNEFYVSLEPDLLRIDCCCG
jgi:hypothetical protein